MKIKNRKGDVIYEDDSITIKESVENAVKSNADLSGACLSGADLTGADLLLIKNDLYEILNKVPGEVPALKAAMLAGKIDGTTYEGYCCCLVGTIYKHDTPETEEVYNSRNAYRPIERFFLAIRPGHTPENNPVSKIVFDWIEEWENINATK
ncbi:MAG TPA: pentapeptide repeat-containing protein [Saprospiraceae bacterium]|nr:pentapeptide repeat-containing protein [Saprospiraceae bacterium]HNT22623.1 pentapeptide repeat-containing protein [Saprospiraceae bacterium]